LPGRYHHFLQPNKEDKITKDCLSVVDDPSRLNVVVSESVIEIAPDAFRGTQLASITIPDSVETIGSAAFRESQLANITFSENSKLKSLTGCVFHGVPLTSIEIPASVTTILAWSVEIPLLTSITIPAAVTTIAEYAFKSSPKLTNIVFQENSALKSIGKQAFYNIPIASITIPDSVTIGAEAFYKCPFKIIKINCRTLDPNDITTMLSRMYSTGIGLNSEIDTLQIAFSSLLIDEKSLEEIKDYVAGVLSLNNPKNNALINAIYNKSGLFELDLSNTDFIQDDIANLPKTLPWTVIADGKRIKYEIQE
jgi:hypothetical protein